MNEFLVEARIRMTIGGEYLRVSTTVKCWTGWKAARLAKQIIQKLHNPVWLEIVCVADPTGTIDYSF